MLPLLQCGFITGKHHPHKDSSSSFLSETNSHCVAQACFKLPVLTPAGFELLLCLPQPQKCWDFCHAPLESAEKLSGLVLGGRVFLLLKKFLDSIKFILLAMFKCSVQQDEVHSQGHSTFTCHSYESPGFCVKPNRNFAPINNNLPRCPLEQVLHTKTAESLHSRSQEQRPHWLALFWSEFYLPGFVIFTFLLF